MPGPSAAPRAVHSANAALAAVLNEKGVASATYLQDIAFVMRSLLVVSYGKYATLPSINDARCAKTCHRSTNQTQPNTTMPVGVSIHQVADELK